MNLSADTLKQSQSSDRSVTNITNISEVGGEGVYLGAYETPWWNLNTILVICFGPLGVVLLVSYIVLWYQVVQKIQENKQLREKELLEKQHSKASALLSIRALERQTGTFMDMAEDSHDEYGIELIKDTVFSKYSVKM